jgi:hypothetical protein
MHKNEIECLIKLKIDLQKFQNKVSQLEAYFKILAKANREDRVPSSQFTIKHFVRGDLS